MDDLKGGVLTLEHRYQILGTSEEEGLTERYQGRVEPFGLDVGVHVFNLAERVGLPEPVAASINVRIRRAALSASRLRGRHVVRVLDYGELNTTLSFLITDRVSRLRLDQIVNSQGRLPMEGTLRVVMEVAEALTEVHDLGVGHFAVRPEHVWFEQTASGTYARLGGMGYTLLRHELSLLDTQVAYPTEYADHLAPETFADVEARAWLDSIELKGSTAEDFDERWGVTPNEELAPSPNPSDPIAADVFGLAVLAYRCLKVTHPYLKGELRNWRETLEGLASGELLSPSEHGVELPDAVWRVLKSGLARDPGARPPSALSFAEEFEVAVLGRKQREQAQTPAELTTEDLVRDPRLWGDDELEAKTTETTSEMGSERHPRVRLLTVGLVMLLVTNLVTLGIMTQTSSSPMSLSIVSKGGTLEEIGPDGDKQALEVEEAQVLPKRREVWYRLSVGGESRVELRWKPMSHQVEIVLPEE